MQSNLAKKIEIEEIEDSLVFDFSYYAPRCLRIQTMEGELVPFKLNEPQKFIEQIIAELKAEGRFIRLIVLKARREGVSTYTEGRFYWKTSTRFNRYAVCVTHEPDATETLFAMTKRFHDYAPPEFRPATKYSNQKQLAFNTPDGKGLDSAFRVGTADKKNFGSGQLIHYLHLSEVAKWPKHTEKDLLVSLLQCVPDEPDTEIIFESTAQGIGGEFYIRFFAARYRYDVILKDGKPVLRKTINENAVTDNAYCAVFLPWYIFPKYQMDPPEGFVRYKKPEGSQDTRACEETLVKLYGLTDKHLAWRRWAIENKCGGSEDIFAQEYPSNPTECFLSSGRPVFDNKLLMLLKNAAPAPVQRYECLLSTGQWIARADGRLRVWKEPNPLRSYVISADVAEGLEHGDFSCADVLDFLTGEQVAHWHGHIDPDEFGRLLVWLGKRYNTAWIIPERNNHGITTVLTISKLDYPRLYAEMVPEPPGKPRKRYGWVTSSVTRPLVIDGLVEAMRTNTHGINNAETFEEMMNFKTQPDGTQEADEGMWDDRVLSIAIAHHVRKVLPNPKMNIPAGNGAVHASAVRSRKPNMKAFT